jgi:hypothetical protein
MSQSAQFSAFRYQVPSGISNVITATSNVALTSTKTLVVATPDNFGMKVTLPDATTMNPDAFVHAIDNRSDYHIRVHNAADVLIGFVPQRTYSPISLVNASTLTGQWDIVNGQRIGFSSQLNSTVLASFYSTGASAVDMGSNIEIIYGYKTDGQLAAVAHNRNTGTFGTPVVIRAQNIPSHAAAIKHTSTQLLVVSVRTTDTDLQAVIVSLNTSTLALTVNTAATATLGGNITNFVTGSALVALPSLSDSFVISYLRATSVAGIRAISVSGTTVTIGAETALSGSTGGNLVATADKVIAASVSTDGQTIYTRPYTISGSTITAGTGTTTGSVSATTIIIDFFFALGSRWGLFFTEGTTDIKAAIVSLSTTTTSINAVAAGTSGPPSDCMVINSSKAVFGNASIINILTDSSGTPSVGTALSQTMTNRRFLWLSNNVVMAMAETATSQPVALFDVSGTSPTLLKTVSTSQNSFFRKFSAPDVSLNRNALGFYASNFAHSFGATSQTNPFYAEVTAAGLTAKLPIFAGYSTAPARGRNDLERWWANGVDLLTKVECAA